MRAADCILQGSKSDHFFFFFFLDKEILRQYPPETQGCCYFCPSVTRGTMSQHMHTGESSDLERPKGTGRAGARRSSQPFTGMAVPGEFGDERGLPALVDTPDELQHPMDRARRARKAAAAIVSRNGRSLNPAGLSHPPEPSKRSPRALTSIDPALLQLSDRQLRDQAHHAAGARHPTQSLLSKGEPYLSPRKVSPRVTATATPYYPGHRQQPPRLDAPDGQSIDGDVASADGSLAPAASPRARSPSALLAIKAPPLTPRGLDRPLPLVPMSSTTVGNFAGAAVGSSPRRQPHTNASLKLSVGPDLSPPRREAACTHGRFLVTRRTERLGLQTSRSASRAALSDPIRPSVFSWPPEETVASAAYLLALELPERAGRHGSRDPSKAVLHLGSHEPEVQHPSGRLPAHRALSQAASKRHGLAPAISARELQVVRDGGAITAAGASSAHAESIAATARWRESTVGGLRATHVELLASCRSARGDARPTIFVVQDAPTPRHEAHPNGVWRGTAASEIRTRQRAEKNGELGLLASCIPANA
jgi:hypothetical protein